MDITDKRWQKYLTEALGTNSARKWNKVVQHADNLHDALAVISELSFSTACDVENFSAACERHANKSEFPWAALGTAAALGLAFGLKHNPNKKVNIMRHRRK